MSTRLIIVLGYTLSNNCQIQPILKSRLDEAISVYRQTDKILVCGKMPPKLLMPTRCEKVTEAEIMKQYLIENNIPELDIIKEEQSTTTFGNAFYSLDFINNQLPSSILIISNEFHYPLVKYSFNKVLGSKYNYRFHIVPDSCLKVNLEEIERWEDVVNKMVDTYYPLLFDEVNDGDIDELRSIIEGPINPTFETYVKNLLSLKDSADIKDFICG